MTPELAYAKKEAASPEWRYVGWNSFCTELLALIYRALPLYPWQVGLHCVTMETSFATIKNCLIDFFYWCVIGPIVFDSSFSIFAMLRHFSVSCIIFQVRESDDAESNRESDNPIDGVEWVDAREEGFPSRYDQHVSRREGQQKVFHLVYCMFIFLTKIFISFSELFFKCRSGRSG